MEFKIMVAEECHTVYSEAICEEIYISSLERKTGIANQPSSPWPITVSSRASPI